MPEGITIMREVLRCFVQRVVVGAWNNLPGMVMEPGEIVAFKRHLDKHMDMQVMEG